MKYYLIAGEASGDLHASNLMKELKAKDSSAEFRFWGGDLMQAEGGTLVKHYKELAFMGFIEVVMNLKTILNNLKKAKKDILAWQPDVVIFVDYPGFNLRLAPFVHKHGIKSVYYISPQVWAWKAGRVEAIKKYIDKMLVILPFEKSFYADRGYEVDFVGHPLLDAIACQPKVEASSFRLTHGLDDRPIIALLPGSRKQEIKAKLPIMVKIAEEFPRYQFVVAQAPGLASSFYDTVVPSTLHKVSNKTYALLSVAHAALVTSGTATLETALFKVPQVVCYKGNPISYQIAKRLVKHIQYISLVNLILGKEVVTELIQDELTYENVKNELQKILAGEGRANVLKAYEKLEDKLGGGASKKAANKIIALLKP